MAFLLVCRSFHYCHLFSVFNKYKVNLEKRVYINNLKYARKHNFQYKVHEQNMLFLK